MSASKREEPRGSWLGAVLAHHLAEGLGDVLVGLGRGAAAQQRGRGDAAGLDAVRRLQQVVVYFF